MNITTLTISELPIDSVFLDAIGRLRFLTDLELRGHCALLADADSLPVDRAIASQLRNIRFRFIDRSLPESDPSEYTTWWLSCAPIADFAPSLTTLAICLGDGARGRQLRKPAVHPDNINVAQWPTVDSLFVSLTCGKSKPDTMLRDMMALFRPTFTPASLPSPSPTPSSNPSVFPAAPNLRCLKLRLLSSPQSRDGSGKRTAPVNHFTQQSVYILPTLEIIFHASLLPLGPSSLLTTLCIDGSEALLLANEFELASTFSLLCERTPALMALTIRARVPLSGVRELATKGIYGPESQRCQMFWGQTLLRGLQGLMRLEHLACNLPLQLHIAVPHVPQSTSTSTSTSSATTPSSSAPLFRQVHVPTSAYPNSSIDTAPSAPTSLAGLGLGLEDGADAAAAHRCDGIINARTFFTILRKARPTLRTFLWDPPYPDGRFSVPVVLEAAAAAQVADVPAEYLAGLVETYDPEEGWKDRRRSRDEVAAARFEAGLLAVDLKQAYQGAFSDVVPMPSKR